MSRPYLILSLDGGGIRGIIASRALERIENARDGVLDRVDLLAGTSTGALIALALAAGHSPAELSALYHRAGDRVFGGSARDDTRPPPLDRSHHTNDQLAAMLHATFGDLRMRDLPKKVLISTFMLDGIDATGTRSWRPKFFHNFENEDEGDRAQLVVDVALRTTAAPTHFPIYQGFIDGGVVANNPGMCALAQALDARTGRQRLEDVFLLSIGTGASPLRVEATDEAWGLEQWAPHLVPLLFDGALRMVDYQCSRVLGERYLRVNPQLPRAVGLGAVHELPLLERIANEQDLDPALTWLDSILVA